MMDVYTVNCLLVGAHTQIESGSELSAKLFRALQENRIIPAIIEGGLFEQYNYATAILLARFMELSRL